MTQSHLKDQKCRRIAILAATFSFFTLAIAAPASSTTRAVGSPRTMSVPELLTLYGGKTWVWGSGGGYLAPGGKFTAFVGNKSEAESTYANGRWWVTAEGIMCFRATWHVRTSDKQDQKCFGHRVDGDVIFQRLEPDGFWYVFRTEMAAHPQDEFANLRFGDSVSTRANRLQAAFARQPVASSRK